MALVALPAELLEQIWAREELTHVDIVNLGQVCSVFHDISLSNEVWKDKFSQRYPELLSCFHHVQDVNWKAAFQGRHSCGVVVARKVGSMSAAHYHQEEPSEETYDELKQLADQSVNDSDFIIDALMDITFDGVKKHNLTHKYYAIKTLRFMRHLQLKKEWDTFLALPPEEQLLEKGAVLLSQWCQPTFHVSHTGVVWELDRLASLVREKLRHVRPEHPACRTQEEMPMYLDESLMSASHSRIALEALNNLLYNDFGFRGNDQDYYHPHNSFIDQVLKRKLGIPISLAVIYISVARRLGVRCDPVNFPNHFLIKFKEHPELPPDQAFTYIDVFHDGKFMSASECMEIYMMRPVAPSEVFKAVPPSKVMARMVLNLIHIGRQQGQMGDGLMALRNSVELGIILIPDSLESCTLLARLNMHLGININETIEMLERVSGRFPAGLENPLHILMMNARILQGEKETEEEESHILIVPKLRSRNWRVHYSVGLIMEHKKYNYMCVVTGWDDRCKASREWMSQMSVHNLANQGSQPFYNVLVEDGSDRYAAQENLSLAKVPRPIPHREVGKYFDEFCGTHYMLNHQKNQQYPEDLEKTFQFVNATYHK